MVKITSVLLLCVASAYAQSNSTPSGPSPSPPSSTSLTRRRRSYDPPGAACTAANFGTVCNQGTRRRMGSDQQCCAATSTQTNTVKTGNCVYDCTTTSDYQDDSGFTSTHVTSANARPYQLCQEVNNSTGDRPTSPPRASPPGHQAFLGICPGCVTRRTNKGP